jgi:DNA-binding transcriptional ArsR family regulator
MSNSKKITATGTITGEKKSVYLYSDTIKKAFLILRALNHPLRQRIIEILSEDAKLGVIELAKALKIQQPDCSRHLAVMRHAGILVTERSGRTIYYKVDINACANINLGIEMAINTTKNAF